MNHSVYAVGATCRSLYFRDGACRIWPARLDVLVLPLGFHEEGVTSSSLVPGFTGRLARTLRRRCRLPPVDFALSDEQKDFVDAIRDFCDRECGTPDQRERLTEGYREHHNFDIYRQMAE